MCMMVVGFASEGKQHLNEQQLQNPTSIVQQDKADAYKVQKKLTEIQKQHKAEAYNETKLVEEQAAQGLSRAFQDRSVEWDTFPFDEVSERDTWIYVYMEDSYGDGWNGNELCVAELGACISPDMFGSGGQPGIWVDLTAALGGYMFADGDYTITCDGGSWQGEVSWAITDDGMNTLLAGGAPFSGTLTLGGGGGGCAEGEFTCDDGACIPGSWECDVYWCDCAGCEDEADCGGGGCADGEFTCDDGSCIYGSWECDNWADCADGSDEADCAPASCEDQGLWDCGDGQCIPNSYVCDGSSEFCNAGWPADCANGADEGLENCGYADECAADPTCADTDCGYWLNYGYSCEDLGGWGYDCSLCDAEGACPAPQTCEESGGVEDCSGDGDCAPGSWVGDGWCDGEDQPYGYDLTCYDNDGGDCAPAGCADDQYTCSDGACIPDYWECDGWNDCSDSGDEADCGAASCEDQGLWDCGDGQCIPTSYVCDGSSEFCNAGWPADCANGADEGLDACGYADECGPGVCEDCVYDFTPYGAECCDAAADAFGLSCAALEGNYNWDCEGWTCPLDEDGWDDLTCAEQGALDDCSGDGDCCPSNWVGDGWADGSDQPYGCDLTCYECDGGDVASDCAGTCEGTASNDDCGVCDGDNSSCADCAGVPNGDSFTDCAGDCVEGWLAGYLGDGWCDDGSWGVDLTCESCDNGDCNQSDDPGADCYVEPECSFFDCVGTCADGYESWVGDGWCDGTPQQYGFDFTCLDCDGGDCAGECGCETDVADGACDCDGNTNDECGVCGGDNSSCADCAGTPNGDAVEDCADDDCIGGSWIGDGWCDGADQAWGADLTCYDCDGGDCMGACGCDDNDSCNDCCGVANGDNSSCGGSGDVNGGGVDVTDIIAMVSDILETEALGECAANEADITGDGTLNVLDVIAAVEIILSGSGDDGGDDGGVACDEGYVADCADDDCCPESWVGDGFADCEEQAYGCDLTCYDNDGGDCDEAADDGGDTGGSDTCSDCEFDFTPYGSECCDTAFDEYGLSCAALEANYNWDCAGCACPGDVAGECGDGTCNVDEDCSTCLADCPYGCGECGEGTVADCDGSGECFSDTWIGDGLCDGADQNWGADLTCYDNDGGDCDECGSYDCGDTDGGDTGGSDTCSDCEFDWSNYGSECCDTAWDEYGLNCATLSSNYGWDCTGCACPGDETGDGGDGGGCADGYVEDCVDDDCCAEGWIGDGYGDCEDQAYGCDLTCYDNDGGDCAAGDDGGSEACSDCAYDFTPYGSECCDTAWDAFGIDCATLEANYGWDCAGCGCPGDTAGDDGGAGCADGEFTCDDGACIPGSWECDVYWCDCAGCEDEADCGGDGCADGEFDCGDGQCIPGGYYCDGSSEFCNAGWGPDCANGADEGLDTCGYEDECAAGCADGEFTCDDGACIPGSWECDVYYCDCAGCEDEANCGGDECVNDDSTADSYGDTCSSWYDSYESPGSYGCEGGYNDDDFDAGAQCCACGGGSTGGRATVDSEKVMKMQFQSRLNGTDIRTMAIKKASAVKMVTTIINKDRSLPVYNKIQSIDAAVKTTVSSSRFMVKSIAKDVGKNPADVIKNGATLGRKATGFESKLQKANDVELIQTAEGLKYKADGFVGFEITLSHGADFEINVTNSAFIADYNTVGNTTRVIVVNPETADLFTSTGDYEIVDVIAGTSGGTALSADIVSIPTVFGLNGAYPNPFNPTTSVELTMPQDGFVSVKVYNLMGQVVATLHEGDLTANSYSFTWDAADVASGMYLLQAETAGNVDVQKIMLMK